MKIVFIILAICSGLLLLRKTKPYRGQRRDAWLLMACYVLSVAAAYLE